MSVYQLRCTLYGHTMDVRSLTVSLVPEGLILSGSRDKTTKAWSPVDYSQVFVETQTFIGHSNFVSCICTLPPDETYPTGLILTGSNDKTICAYTLDNPEPRYRLTGHSNSVCALAAGKFGTVISGSWDQTAKVWLGQKNLFTLQGHAAAVWAVSIMTQHGVMLTGSADKTIKMWKTGKCERTFEGHTDCVRALTVISEMEFLSASNDTTIRRWVITGECLAVLQGHENYVYSVTLMPNGLDFASCGEDSTLRVWKGGQCQQVIRLPCQSAWAVTALPNSDLAVGTSDGVIRVFSCVKARQADEEERRAYEESLSSTVLSSGLIGDVKVSELPGTEVLYEPGMKDGQTKMVREGEKVSAHQWSAAESRWIKIGDVVGTPGTQTTGNNIQFEGKEYDYVFDVAMEEGQPTLKLPFNVTEDPWFAAQRFLERNNLSQMFLDQVTDFIIKNTQGMTLTGPQQPRVNQDPFTGESRYIPSGGDSNVPVTGGSDPFTGTGRYVPGAEQEQHDVQVPKCESQYFPQRTVLTFDVANLGAIQGKLKEMISRDNVQGRQFVESNVDDVVKMSEVTAPCSVSQLGILENMLQWPIEIVFPALDLLRLAIRNKSVNDHFCANNGGDRFMEILLGHVQSDSPVNQLMCLRVVCNMMTQGEGERLAIRKRAELVERLLHILPTDNKNLQIAVCTCFLNYSVLLTKHQDLEAKMQCLSAIANLFPATRDHEAQFRLLVAIGTLIHGDSDSIAIARSLEMAALLLALTSVTDPKKVGECAAALIPIL